MQKNEIIILAWHPTQSNVQYAGGFKRLFELVSRIPKNINLTCLDSKPSFLKSLPVNVIEYSIPKFLTSVTKLNFGFGKLLERIYVIGFLTNYLMNQKTKKTIYVPFSELPHLTIPAVISKLLIGHRLVFCNLNPNIYFFDLLVNRLAHKFSNLNITISKSLQSQLKETGIVCTVVNPVGIDTLAYKPSKKNRSGIFVGRHVAEKGIYTALKVCAEINKTREFVLNCIGDIPGDQKPLIAKLILDLKIEDKVNLLGIVDEETKIKLLGQASVCLFPSVQEGWGIVPQEAILCGTPVVAYDLNVYKENIAECPAVKLVPIGDVSEFTKQVNYWLDVPQQDLTNKLKDSVTIVKKYDWVIIATMEWKLICNI
jgi:glycosyltransferase involved in cell wall biosynthesis